MRQIGEKELQIIVNEENREKLQQKIDKSTSTIEKYED